jgi:hypothetical protein
MTIWIVSSLALYSEDNGRDLAVFMDEAGCYFLRVCWLMVKVVCLLNKGKGAIKKRQRHRKLCNGGNLYCQRHGSL